MTPSPVDLTAVESRWSRSVPLPTLTPALLERVLEPWPELRAREWSLLSGGLRSLNLRADELVLRVALEEPLTLAKEAELLRVAPLGVRTPALLAASERALLIEFVPHEPLPATREAGRAAGAALAHLGATAFEQAGQFNARLEVPDPFPSALDGLRAWAEGLLDGVPGRALGRERVARIRATWDAHAEALAAASQRPVLVHSDFKPTNVKWLPESRDVLVLDWEFAWAGPALYDLGMLLRWSPPEAFFNGVREGLLEGGLALPSDWRRTAEVFDLFNLVGLLQTDDDAQRLEDVRRRVDQTVRDPSGS